MTIIYDPREEAHHNIEVNHIDDVLEVTDTINPYDQKQYKSFTFCNMTKSERKVIECYFEMQLSKQSGVPVKDVNKQNAIYNKIYLPRIGNITLK